MTLALNLPASFLSFTGRWMAGDLGDVADALFFEGVNSTWKLTIIIIIIIIIVYDE